MNEPTESEGFWKDKCKYLEGLRDRHGEQIASLRSALAASREREKRARVAFHNIIRDRTERDKVLITAQLALEALSTPSDATNS